MRITVLLCFLALSACSSSGQKKGTVGVYADTTSISDTPEVASRTLTEVSDMTDSTVRTYSNERFRDVTVTKTGANSYIVEGKAQIFEASFGWVIEDGHRELKSGFTTADAGAPAWGNFSFNVEAEKERPNSALHLILFETSMKDGSRQHELPIRLD